MTTNVKDRFLLLRDLPEDLVLWRYMNLWKLEDLIKKKALYFTPGYRLRDAEPYEFRVPVQRFEKWYADSFTSMASEMPDESERYRFLSHCSNVDRYLYSTGISCWHINEFENNAMWGNYITFEGGKKNGVAIKTTIGRLRTSLSYLNGPIEADLVQYIDYVNGDYAPHPSAVGFEQLFHKAVYFSYEKEFRLVTTYCGDMREHDAPGSIQMNYLNTTPQGIASRQYFLTHGPLVPVDVHELIEEIVIKSTDDPAFFEQASGVITASLGNCINVRPSDADVWRGRP